MRRLLSLAAVAAALLASACLSAAAARAAGPLGLPSSDARLFAVQAGQGRLERVGRVRGRYVLRLGSVASQSLWFSDRPTRHSGSVGVARLLAAWKRLGFQADPPHAVISLPHGRPAADAMAVELGRPAYDARTRSVSFPVRTLGQLSAGLAHLGPDLDPRVPGRFGDATLFIDGTGPDGTSPTGAPPTGTGPVGGGRRDSVTCSAIAEFSLHAAPYELESFLQADGQRLEIARYGALYALLGDHWGSDRRSFALPRLAAPANLQWDVCVNGDFPAYGDGAVEWEGSNTATCAMGAVVLHGSSSRRAGWALADGGGVRRDSPSGQRLADALGDRFGGDRDTVGLPSIPGPDGLRYYVCSGGQPWKAGGEVATCVVGEVDLFATAGLPANYLPADGRMLQIRDLQELYTVYGTSFGGDAETTFNLPRMAGPVTNTTYGVCTRGAYPVRS